MEKDRESERWGRKIEGGIKRERGVVEKERVGEKEGEREGEKERGRTRGWDKEGEGGGNRERERRV